MLKTFCACFVSNKSRYLCLILGRLYSTNLEQVVDEQLTGVALELCGYFETIILTNSENKIKNMGDEASKPVFGVSDQVRLK